jgi:hypothetical protein
MKEEQESTEGGEFALLAEETRRRNKRQRSFRSLHQYAIRVQNLILFDR